MPFVTERWSGGMLTNFQTTRKSIRKMTSIDKMKTDGTWETLNKRERLFKTRQREKLEKNFGSIADMTRQPAAIFIVDILKEHIALSEAKRLNIPTFGMVDTNSNPKLVDFPIPSNDDATKSITIIMDEICGAIKEGLSERKNDKDMAAKDSAAKAEKKEAAKVIADAAPVEKAPAAEAVVEAPKTEEAPKEEAANKTVAKKAPVKAAESKEEAPEADTKEETK
jgi:small subunit ribosomal protein S2